MDRLFDAQVEEIALARAAANEAAHTGRGINHCYTAHSVLLLLSSY